MKKRAVLFLLVLCAVLSFACSALGAGSHDDQYKALPITDSIYSPEQVQKLLRMEKITVSTSGQEEVLVSGDWVKIGSPLSNLDIVIGNDKSDTLTAFFYVSQHYNPKKITIKKGATLTGNANLSFVDCPIDNYGTIGSFTTLEQKKTVHYNTVTYTGTVYNYGTINGGIFTGTVINMPGGTITSGDFSKATLKVQDASGKQTVVNKDAIQGSAFDKALITVTLDLDGGALAKGDEGKLQQTIMRGASLKTNPPTKEGKQFAYWEDEHGYHYTNDSISLRKSDDTQMKLKAVWADFLIFYKAVSPSDNAIPVVTTMPLPQAFTIGEPKVLEEADFVYYDGNGDAYRGTCWNTQMDGLGRNYISSIDYPFTATEFGSMTLYARWKTSVSMQTDGYSVLYRYDKDSPTSYEEVINPVGQWSIHLLKDPKELGFTTPRGKKFAGWLVSPSSDKKDWINTDAERKISFTESTETYQPGEMVHLALWEDPYPYKSGEKLAYSKKTIITAKWDSLPVTEITFNANGTDVTGTTGNGNKETYYLNETPTLPKNGFVRTDYIFTGWNTKPDGTGTSYDDEAKITIEGEALEGKNVTLYAQWKSNTAPATPTPPPATPLPPTGDNANLTLWMALCIASAAALIVMKNRRFSQR